MPDRYPSGLAHHPVLVYCCRFLSHLHRGGPITHSTEVSNETREFLERLDRAVGNSDARELCAEVKAALTETTLTFPDGFLRESKTRYARRLLHRCPNGTYSVMVMVWAPGQGTAVHDHAGKWCVECVHQGRIEITAYEPTSDVDRDLVHFKELRTEIGMPGDVGILIPPNEYHSIRNASSERAVTIHVYAGEMLWCHAFHPLEEGVYRRERLSLEYTG